MSKKTPSNVDQSWIDVVTNLKDQRLVMEGVLTSNLPPSSQTKDYEEVEDFLSKLDLSNVDWKEAFLYQYYLMFTPCSFTRFKNMNVRRRKKAVVSWFENEAMVFFGDDGDADTPVDNQVYIMVDGVLVPAAKK